MNEKVRMTFQFQTIHLQVWQLALSRGC